MPSSGPSTPKSAQQPHFSVQGIRWVINREEANGLTIIQQSQKGYIDKVISCIENGKALLIENLPDDIDAVLDPVVGKMTMRRGQNLVIKIGDNEVDYDRNFRLYLQTKLSNPHYKPEINAQVRLPSLAKPCEPELHTSGWYWWALAPNKSVIIGVTSQSVQQYYEHATVRFPLRRRGAPCKRCRAELPLAPSHASSLCTIGLVLWTVYRCIWFAD